MLNINLGKGERLFIGTSFCVILNAIQSGVPKSVEIVVVSKPDSRRSSRVMQVEDEMEIERHVILKVLRIRPREAFVGIRADTSVAIFREAICPPDVLRMWTEGPEAADTLAEGED